jgi:uncharacterized protein (PEP-CTERM system associated)
MIGRLATMNRIGLVTAWAWSACAVGSLLDIGACAAEWRATPRIAVRESVTDNVRLTRDDRRTDLVTTLSPGIALSATGGRIRFDLDYAANYDSYMNTSAYDGLRHDLRGLGTVELLRDRLHVDIAAFAGQSPILARGQASGIDRGLGAGGTSQIFSHSVSPYWRSRLGSWSEAELRYRFGQILSRRQSGDDDGVGSPPLLADTDMHSLSGDLRSGEAFGRLRWRVGANRVEAFRDTTSATSASTAYRRQTLELQPAYTLARWITLLATAGYENIESDDFRRPIEGGFWNGGVRLTPSQRSSVELTYGGRYGGPNWSASASLETPAGTRLALSYREAVETQALQALEGLGFLVRDLAGNIVDTRTGLPYMGRDPFFDQSDRVFLGRALTLNLRIPFPRDTLLLSAQQATRATGFADTIDGPGREDRSRSLSATWERQVTPTATTTARIFALETRSDPGDGTPIGRSRQIGIRFGLDFALNDTLRLGAGYSLLQRDVTDGGAANTRFTGDYVENVVFVSLRKTF